MKRPLAAAALSAVLAPTSVFAQVPVESTGTEPPPAAVQSITGREIAGHLRFLASDLLRGREAGTADARMAAEYLASHLTAIGAEPLGDPVRGRRTYLQGYTLEAVTPPSEGPELTLTLRTGDAVRVITGKLGVDFIYGPNGVVAGEVEAPAVFVGYARDEADKGIDDFAGVDVRNKFALAYRGVAPGAANNPGAAYAASQARVRTARAKGALGVLLIDAPGDETARPALPAKPNEMGFDRTRIVLGPTPAQIPAIALSGGIRDVLVPSLGLSVPEASPPKQEGGSLQARFVHAVRREPREDRNVVGFLPGSDPEKKKEVVVFSAHYDHEGVDEKGEIYNGSDDNASGTSGVLEIAEAFGVAPRPARSVAFLWVSGEEKGLLGSKWFADHPALPEGAKIVADINLDMISRNDTAKIGATPSPSHPDYNTLVADAALATKAEGLEMLFDTDPYYGRTDSYNFAAKGIPVIFFFAGLHEDYHKPTDDVEKADFEKAARVARAAFRLGWKVAQDAEAPKKIQAQP